MNARGPVLAFLLSLMLLGLGATLLGGWFLLAAGAQADTSCAESQRSVDTRRVPAELVPLFDAAARHYRLGADGPAVLAGLTKVESDFGQNMGPSSAGAVGWTQFMPATWRQYGVDADGDGRRDPKNAADAIYSAARYLRALGAPASWRRALFGYNHADWYVNQVLDESRKLAAGDTVEDISTFACSAAPAPALAAGPGGRVVGGGRIVPIPWQPGESIDERLLPDLALLHERFNIAVTDGYATTGHAPDGEHPLGLGADIVPGPGGTWEDIDRLATIAEPTQGNPVAPFRWVGYDGDRNHGRGNHLHLSWHHGAPRPGHRPPAAWVDVMATAP